jgi:transcriptional regulator with XRE-family HTH domain
MRFIRQKSQMQLAKETGLIQSRISALENGLLRPRPQDRILLAEALNIHPKRLKFPVDYEDDE